MTAHPLKTEDETSSHRCIFVLATRQGGFVSRQQLLAAGLRRGGIDSQIRNGRLIRAFQGAYAVGHMPTEPRARAFGAQLAAGSRSALAAGSAASFYGYYRKWSEPFEVLSPCKIRVDGLIAKMTSTLLLRDVWTFDGLRVTSPARTALDLAPRLSEKQLKAAVEHLRLRNTLSLDQLRDVLARNPKHPGTRPLREIIGSASRRPTRSGLEREWPAFAERFDLPAYETNVMVAGKEVDVLVAGVLVVELDTWRTHELNFETDRDRDAQILAAVGVPVIRVTDRQFHKEPEVVAQRIVQVVARIQAAS